MASSPVTPQPAPSAVVVVPESSAEFLEKQAVSAWKKLQSNPWFSAAEGGFALAAIQLLATWYQSGSIVSMVTTQAGWKALVSAGIGGMLIALRNLYKTSPDLLKGLLMKYKIIAVLLVLACGLASAQTPPPAPPPAPLGFTGGSDAIAFHYSNGWSAGTTVTESFDFMDFGASKTNRLFLEGKELLAPTPGLNLYMGGIAFQPDFTKALAKTNVTPGSFSAIFDASVGDGLPGAGGSHIAYQVGAGVKYQVTSSLTWQSLNAFYGRFGSTPFAGVSTGLAYFFSK